MLRFFHKNKRLSQGIALAATSALLILAAVSPSFFSAAAARKLPVYSVSRDDKCISLTFDAAWGNVILRQVSAPGHSYTGENILVSKNRLRQGRKPSRYFCLCV